MSIKDISIRMVKPDGTHLFFPDYTTLTLSPLLNDIGGISFTAQANAKNFQYLYSELDAGRDVPFLTFIDGVAHPELDFYITDMDGDDVVEGNDWTFTGVTNEYRLQDASVIPRNTIIPPDPRSYTIQVGDTLLTVMQHLYDAPLVESQYQELRANNPPLANVYGNKTSVSSFAGLVVTAPAGANDQGTLTAEKRFDNANAGEMMKFFMDEAFDRDLFEDITYNSFNDVVDSNLIPWAKEVSIGVSPGLSYLDFAKALVQLQMADFRMVGKDFRLYNYGTLSEDLTTGNNPLIFHAGKDIVDSPRKLTVRDSATSIIMAGDNGVYSLESDATAIANRGRIVERYLSQGGVTDQGTLDALAQQQLPLVTPPTLEKTNGLSFALDTKQPIIDFNNGDWVYTDVGNGLERYRVLQWTLTVDNNRQITGSVTLNNLIADRLAKIIDSINGITQGTTILGTSVTDPNQGPDVGIPSAVTGLSATSLAYIDPQGNTLVTVDATWDPVITNEDGTTADDIDHYVIQWEDAASGAFFDVPPVTDTEAVWSQMLPYITITIYVSAVDSSGNQGDAGTYTLVLAHDVTPPAVPATPVCDNYLGLARAYWNGKDSAGAAMAVDFDHIEVHWSTSSGFTPSAATLSDNLRASGYTYKDTGGVYGTTFFCKFIAVDQAGNKSAATPSGVGAVPDQVVSADILDGAVGTAKLADLAVVNAKIGNLAVNDAKIGSVSIGKLTAGTMSADLIVSGRIATALSGARCLFDATGIHLYNSVGTLVVDINTSGAATFTGTFATGTSGNYIKSTTDGRTTLYYTNLATGVLLASQWTFTFFSTTYHVPFVGLGTTDINQSSLSGTAWNGIIVADWVASDSTGVGIVINANPAHFNVVVVRGASVALSGISGSAVSQLSLDPNNLDTVFANNSSSQMAQGSANFGPSTAFYATSGSGITMSVAVTDFYVRFIDSGGSGSYAALRASAFTVVSSEKFKTDVVQYDEDPMSVILQTPVFKYRRTRPAGHTPDRPGRNRQIIKGVKTPKWVDSHESLGLIVEQAHESLIVPGGEDGIDGVDIYHMASVMWAALQQMDTRMKELEKK